MRAPAKVLIKRKPTSSLEKHLRRDGSLPPGPQKRVQRFPEDLDRRVKALSEMLVAGDSLRPHTNSRDRWTNRKADLRLS